jgi:hypothetical protein
MKERKYSNVFIYAKYYCRPCCPMCGMSYDEIDFGSMDDVEQFLYEYMQTDKYICSDCMLEQH